MQIGRYQQAGRVLDDNQPSAKLVNKIADRIIGAVQKQDGGGYQSHIKDFQWSVTVVDEKQPNAFVLPGQVHVRSALPCWANRPGLDST